MVESQFIGYSRGTCKVCGRGFDLPLPWGKANGLRDYCVDHLREGREALLRERNMSQGRKAQVEVG